MKDNIHLLLKDLHREDYANILVFVTHHTKDSWVLEEIKSTLASLFVEQKPATLSKEQLHFMSEFIAQIPELIIEQRGIREERDKVNARLDQIEKNSDDYEQPDILAKINKTFKGMEIAGQIIRNRHATLTKDALFQLANQGSITGLRFLDYFIELSDVAKNEVVNLIGKSLQDHPNVTNEQINKQAANIFQHLTYGIINGVIRKIASSIGSKQAAEIYKKISEETPSPALILLDQAISLQFNRDVDFNKLNTSVTMLKPNPVCTRILKEMVIQHTYMFPVNFREKQQLSEMLDISIKQQRIMDAQKRAKG
ncbi:MAG: hypothetical protein P4L95_09200 [Rouxiella aceris]|uniref:hypothetical protein n=1 Tax=Rouxiella aceris TaxID=2703884 RepID=UPI0028421697|nr:hypothetical protein [Rouxiella aceris]MDR3432060.1 hypothetical protein [Rouxiella aceris]